MLCSKKCPRKLGKHPIANLVSESSFVCICLHGEKIKEPTDIYRHCFKSFDSDTMHDYNKYDLISVVNVFSEALLLDELMQK